MNLQGTVGGALSSVPQVLAVASYAWYFVCSAGKAAGFTLPFQLKNAEMPAAAAASVYPADADGPQLAYQPRSRCCYQDHPTTLASNTQQQLITVPGD